MIQSCRPELFPSHSVGRNGTKITGLLVVNADGVFYLSVETFLLVSHPLGAKWLQLGKLWCGRESKTLTFIDSLSLCGK